MQESQELELSRWVIVHETPMLGWLAELVNDPEKFGWPNTGTELELQAALVLHTLMVPGPGGTMNMLSIVSAPHGLSAPPSMSITARGLTLVKSLPESDQRELARKIQACFDQLLKQRAAQAGIVLGGAGR